MSLVRTFAPRNVIPSRTFVNFPSLLEGFLGEFDSSYAGNQANTLPAVNVIEKSDSFSLELAAPGLKKEDFKINVNENVLTISAEKKVEDKEVKDKYTRQEFSYTSFKRSFTLAKSIDGEKINASYNEGILSIELPKREEAKPKEPRLIEIA
jgi:HSP20 family protein